MKDVMIDLETLGVSTNAPIIQIGACYFDRFTGEIGKIFKVNVNLKSAVKSGAVIDPDTVCWWLQQSDEARKSILAAPNVDIFNAIEQLNTFLSGCKNIWSHATFDFVIIQETYRRLGIKPSFQYKAARDIRTLNDLSKGLTQKEDHVRDGVHHDALEDAKFQVKYCVAALKCLKNKQ